ncbi:MAG: hypothetical protein HY700_02695 [Gemmatimonadetes bacterium]|nr:hypothetical protein [Gemmatimonadota bacterium]
MKLDAKALGIGAGITAAIVAAVCRLAAAIAPGATAAFFGYLLHLDLSAIARTPTWGSFFAGVIVWGVGTGLVFALGGWLYNRIAQGERGVPAENRPASIRPAEHRA